MNGMLDMRVLELLTARLCHDLIGPITAVGNGAELLSEDGPDFAPDALQLVADSARRAAGRLQFYRFAYGFDGRSAAAGPPPCELAARLFTATRIVCDYRDAVRALPLDRQKLGCSLLPVAAQGLAGGGRLTLDAGPAGLQLEAVGDAAALAPDVTAALMLETPAAALTSRTVQAHLAGLLAQALGWRLVGEAAGRGRFRLASVSLAR